jgi:hypothetical protein
MTVSRISNIQTLSNYSEFRAAVTRHGYSINNLYDVIFNLPASTNVFNELIAQYSGADGDQPIGLQECLNLLRLYTNQCTMPGVTMADSEYRVTNTPQLKYAYGAVFNEFSVTFTMDADSLIRKVFDKWTNTIYPYSRFRGDTGNTGPLRTSYKEDYIADISVIKYERFKSSKRNNIIVGSRIPKNRIIPGIDPNDGDFDSGFADNIAVHAVKMKNAFPKSIDSMSLSSEGGALTQFSVAFEYESLQVSTLNELQSFTFDPDKVTENVSGSVLNLVTSV